MALGVDHRGMDLTQDGVELCELSKSSGPDSGCVFALGTYARVLCLALCHSQSPRMVYAVQLNADVTLN